MLLLSAFTFRSNAQYHIISHNWYQDTTRAEFDASFAPVLLTDLGVGSGDTAYFCNNPVFSLFTNLYDTGLTVRTYFGDGTYCTQPVVDSGGYGYVSCYSIYYDYYFMSGTYSVKQVLYQSGVPVDSVSGYIEHFICDGMQNISYYDLSGAGHFVPGTDVPIYLPMSYVVDSGSVITDTSSGNAYSYTCLPAVAGTIYGFRELPAYGLVTTTPAGSINYDTVTTAASRQHFVNYTGNVCSSSSGFDLAVYSYHRSTTSRARLSISIDNLSCPAQDATVTMHFSPKYNFTSSYPAPLSVIGNTVTWLLPALSIYSHGYICVDLTVPGAYLVIGDTLHYDISVTPTTGDINPANNSMVIIDTCRGPWDPNEMSVTPSGTITTGTQLQYTIGFENTGNDTAFNINVYDTLSPNVDAHSLKFVTASAYVNTTTLWFNGQTIVKFDFPHINLLDSSHHNQCDGMLIFTVNSKSGLPNGTTIFNHAGIVFDDNPVVVTDTVENIISTPPAKIAPVTAQQVVTIYPNPANDEVTISADNTSYATATFTNVLGQQVLTQSLTASQTKVIVSSLAPGIYYVTLTGAVGVKVVKLEKM